MAGRRALPGASQAVQVPSVKGTVSVRVVAESEPLARAAVAVLEDKGAVMSNPRPGRKGDWLSYGNLRVQA